MAAVELIEEHPELSAFAGPRSEGLIADAESALAIRFPPTYREFLRRYGAGEFATLELYGVIHDRFSESAAPDAVWFTLKARRDWGMPDHLVVISMDGMGTDFALETNQTDSAGESPVAAWHAGTDAGQHGGIVAPDFGTFLLGEVRRVLGISDPE